MDSSLVGQGTCVPVCCSYISERTQPGEQLLFPLRDNVSRTHEPIVVWAIIALNAVVFFYQLGLSQRELQVFLYQHALVPVRYFSPNRLHAVWLHVIINMWTLWIFGPALEDRLGPIGGLQKKKGPLGPRNNAGWSSCKRMRALNHRGRQC